MKLLSLAIGLGAMIFATSATAQSVYVKPHVRSDGTYVDGHYRTRPNSTTLDNYSTRPNVNPYTGKSGTTDPYPNPYKAPSPYKPYRPKF